MKRTFTVTVEGEDARKRWFDADTIKEHVEGWTDTVVTVTETTAVHAKEREALKALADLRYAEDARSAFLISCAMQDVRRCSRELRALMEGKACPSSKSPS